MSKGRAIGGGHSSLAYLLIFVIGVVIGSGIRAAIAFLPGSVVSAIRRRILPGD